MPAGHTLQAGRPSAGGRPAALSGYEDREVVLGFPDILFEPIAAVRTLLQELASRPSADVVLGLFSHPLSRRADVVELEPGGRVPRVDGTGDPETGGLTWGLAAWRPPFTAFLEQMLSGVGDSRDPGSPPNLGDVLTEAAEAGLTIRGIVVSDAPFLDIGKPEGLAEARRRLRESSDQNR